MTYKVQTGFICEYKATALDLKPNDGKSFCMAVERDGVQVVIVLTKEQFQDHVNRCRNLLESN